MDSGEENQSYGEHGDKDGSPRGLDGETDRLSMGGVKGQIADEHNGAQLKDAHTNRQVKEGAEGQMVTGHGNSQEATKVKVDNSSIVLYVFL